MIAIIDYDAGNMKSVELRFSESVWVSSYCFRPVKSVRESVDWDFWMEGL